MNLVRAKKSRKPILKSTDVTWQDCKRLAKAYYRDNGDAQSSSSKDRGASEKAVAKFAKNVGEGLKDPLGGASWLALENLK